MKATDVNFELVSALRSQPAVSTRRLGMLVTGQEISVRPRIVANYLQPRVISIIGRSVCTANRLGRLVFSPLGCGGYRTRRRRGRDGSFQGVDIHRLDQMNQEAARPAAL